MNNRTLAIIKPDGVKKNIIGKVITKITEAGFKIKAVKMVRLTKDSAGGFYEVHKAQPFYNDLVEFMTSGPCMPMVLEKADAVAALRKAIGATDPAEAEAGTVRKLYAESKERNAIHASDSDDNALHEARFFFAEGDVIGTG